MAKRFLPCDLHQPFLLPPSLQDWLPERHLARFIAEVSEQLDLSEICRAYGGKDGRGKAAYHPLLLTRLLLYGYCVGVVSSRRIEARTHDELAFRFLAADQHPDHDTIAAFRKLHLDQLGQLFGQILTLCRRAGLVKVGAVMLDGTKIGANASRRQSMNEKALQKEDARLAEIARKLLEQAEAVDEEEDARYGKGQRGDELPEELATVEGRRKKIQEAKAALEQEARERAEEAERERAAKKAAGEKPTEAERKQWQRVRRARSQNSAQRNLTDPDSSLMKDSRSGGYLQAYNAQAAVLENQVIVAAEVSSKPGDKLELVPMSAAVERTLEAKPDAVIADAGYWSEKAVTDPCWTGVNLLVAPDRGGASQPLKRNSPRSAVAAAMREKLRSPEGRQLYALRKQTIEPVFGQIKQGRGLRYFLLRGKDKVRTEWRLICASHNLLKLFRAGGMKLLSEPQTA
jgi:transposase